MEIPFRISIFEEHFRAEEATAQQILEQVKQKRNSVIGLATGRTMRGVYRFLIDEEKKEPGLFKDVTFVQLDEIILKTVGEGIFSKELRELFIERLEGGYEAFLSINVFVEDTTKEAKEYLKKPSDEIQNELQHLREINPNLVDFQKYDICYFYLYSPPHDTTQ